jgi:hypothetical protein
MAGEVWTTAMPSMGERKARMRRQEGAGRSVQAVKLVWRRLTPYSIDVKDISLTDYINVNHAVYVRECHVLTPQPTIYLRCRTGNTLA